MQISDRKAVTIHYTVKDEAGEVLDTSRGRDPLDYLQGLGNIVPGLEKALAGKAAGDKLEVTLAPEEAYGVRDEKNVRNVPLRKLSVEGKLAPGARCRVQVPDGFQLGLVQAVRGDYATVDLNHPLAGMRLAFEVEVVAVREATPEELAHGHVHGAGGHH
ncbi:MAG TPA: peptidylprolyl isomerase [Polyangia bacterium]|nr:peptidylprolyl isomerase [Polyangia bacterium]